MFIWFWEIESMSGERQMERETQNLKQAPGSELSAYLNQLSHPGAPVFLKFNFLKNILSKNFFTFSESLYI